jgi:polyphosphate kinase
MVRNIDHRVEATCPIFDEDIKRVIIKILNIQLSDNVKARILDNELKNEYVQNSGDKTVRSQIEIYNYLIAVRQKDIKEPKDLKEAPVVEMADQ